MPRLVGKRSNSDSAIALTFLIAIALASLMEYFGYINVVPGFGRDGYYNSIEHNQFNN